MKNRTFVEDIPTHKHLQDPDLMYIFLNVSWTKVSLFFQSDLRLEGELLNHRYDTCDIYAWLLV